MLENLLQLDLVGERLIYAGALSQLSKDGAAEAYAGAPRNIFEISHQLTLSIRITSSKRPRICSR